MRMLCTWLLAPQLRAEARLTTATALWRMLVAVEDRLGACEQVAQALAPPTPRSSTCRCTRSTTRYGTG
jgi:hypothetical protein